MEKSGEKMVIPKEIKLYKEQELNNEELILKKFKRGGENMIEGVVTGVIGGVCWSVLGYISNKGKEKKTKFEPMKMLKPVIVGAVIGTYAGYTGQIGNWDLIANETWMVPVTAIIDKTVSIIRYWLIKN